MKHTPAPWNICSRDDRNIRNRKGDLIAACGTSFKEIEANAQLIAAAPELLEALKAMMSELEISVGIGKPVSDAYIQAAFAIKKADGK